VQALEASEIKFGADYHDTLTSIVNLASTYRQNGQSKKAEKLQA
jgi:hypothetical protein